ncbi:MAG: ORF6N domain-containing protein [Terriglobia bacterium]|jgi:hypothetical protein
MVKKPAPKQQIVPLEVIERRIYLIRERKVMLDSDLAELYRVETFNLNKAVKRNLDRFPQDFMFQLTREEANVLRFQIGMSKPSGRGGRRYLPHAFTEQGVAMLSSVLNSSRAVQVNIAIMRTFARLRYLLATHKDLAAKLEAMEKKYDKHFKVIFDVLRQLTERPPVRKKGPVGFIASPKEK